jgi:hypothetical protein
MADGDPERDGQAQGDGHVRQRNAHDQSLPARSIRHCRLTILTEKPLGALAYVNPHEIYVAADGGAISRFGPAMELAPAPSDH